MHGTRCRSSLRSLGGTYMLYIRGVSILSQIRAHSCLAGPHKGGTGRIADASRGSVVREDEVDKTREDVCPVGRLRQDAHWARFFGNLVVVLHIKVSRWRYRAERADPRWRALQTRQGHASAKKPRGKAVRGGRGPQTKTLSGPPANKHRYQGTWVAYHDMF